MIIFTVTAVHLYACTDVHELQYKSTNSLSLSLVCILNQINPFHILKKTVCFHHKDELVNAD